MIRDYFGPRVGHLVAVDPHLCRFGDTWRPVCLEDDCNFRGPFVSPGRARDMAVEHTRKTAGTWRPAR
jgi:hypothetical protein